ncbi:hypothetical protein DL766_002223 [Monosporascus sp. MC13-8B]|uniref:Ribonuclease H2 subunit B n=1 Tax=Monosporascus cannonballus TaxID=155416 RepID=A0ABY0GR28_9PEZI|nr:hypothetical protein DL762_010514 [Monosporascus cannonballus]RYO81586.1 hypothetical protein DL763_008537 [Monosporascus cannonballus]RYP36041.1 hypothetical protein DL766_002223 [Monosporascus sp. MC13-8B]
MARTTRSKASAGGGATPAASSISTASSQSRYVLPSESMNPHKVFILPKKATEEARIVSLLNPRYAKPTRYLVCPETGIYEFTRIAAPKTTPRSWLIECSATGALAGKTDEDRAELGTYITKGADLFVATPIDPLFLILPALAAASKSEKRFFLSSDDHFDSILQDSPHLAEVLRWGNVRRLLESRMAAACETSQGGDELMFRFSEEKLLNELVSKAKNMADQPLPKSMEEKFVTKVLEAPMLGMKREATLSISQNQSESVLAPESEATPSTVESSESQSSAASLTSATSDPSEASTAAASVTEESTTTAVTTTEVVAATPQASEEITKLQRLRTAFQFICSSYVMPALAAELKTMLEEKKSTLADFAPLDNYLTQIAKMRQDALAARSMGDYSRKRAVDDEEAAERAEKKRKKEEEDKRKKAGQSRGVRDLQKVNTRGMKKMSDFFKKK